jgi:uncharacterized protein YcfL
MKKLFFISLLLLFGCSDDAPQPVSDDKDTMCIYTKRYIRTLERKRDDAPEDSVAYYNEQIILLTRVRVEICRAATVD